MPPACDGGDDGQRGEIENLDRARGDPFDRDEGVPTGK
jgi:hypothetical protein